MALPPGPRAAVAHQTVRWIRDAPGMLLDCYRQFGDTFTVRLPASGLRAADVVVTSHPETIREVFTGPAEALHAGKAAQVLGPLVGDNSLLLLDGRQHLRQRRLMLPPFHGERMREYAAAMREETVREVERMPDDGELHLHPHLQQITLRVILRTVFGARPGEMSELGSRLTHLLDIGADPRLLLFNLLPIPVGKARRFMQEIAVADRLLYQLIQDRRAQGDTSSGSDVLSMLLEARDEQGEPMTDLELRDELVTLLVAGHETTATALAWTVRLLVEHPEALARAHDEAKAHSDLAADPALPWLDAVIKESLRIRPVVPMVGRVLQVPLSFRGFRLPAGSVIAPSVWLTHHNPAVWDQPGTFRPERFLGEKPNPYAWLPFGGGVRRCLGQAFALTEMKMVLATLLSRVELGSLGGDPVRIVRRSITFAPSDQTRIRIHRRAVPQAA